MMNNIGDAKEALQRALALNPSDNARRHLALAALTQGDMKRHRVFSNHSRTNTG